MIMIKYGIGWKYFIIFYKNQTCRSVADRFLADVLLISILIFCLKDFLSSKPTFECNGENLSSSHKPEDCGTDPFTELHADFGDSRSELTPARCLCGYIVNKILSLSASWASNVGWLLSPNLYTHLLLNLLFLFFPADRKNDLKSSNHLKRLKSSI